MQLRVALLRATSIPECLQLRCWKILTSLLLLPLPPLKTLCYAWALAIAAQ